MAVPGVAEAATAAADAAFAAASIARAAGQRGPAAALTSAGRMARAAALLLHGVGEDACESDTPSSRRTRPSEKKKIERNVEQKVKGPNVVLPQEPTGALGEKADASAAVQRVPVATQRQKPVVQDTGAEDELYVQRSKLWWRPVGGQWKNYGFGEAKLLQHKVDGSVRFTVRHHKTQRVVASHYVVDSVGTVLPICDLAPHQGSDRRWQWNALDTALTEESTPGTSALKFGSKTLAYKFKVAFEGATIQNKLATILMHHPQPKCAEASDAANAVLDGTGS